LKASAQRQLCLPLLPFTHARSESIDADSLNSNFLQLGRSGGRPQRAVHPMRLPVNTDTHYFSRPRTRNLPIVRLATRSATDSPIGTQQYFTQQHILQNQKLEDK